MPAPEPLSPILPKGLGTPLLIDESEVRVPIEDTALPAFFDEVPVPTTELALLGLSRLVLDEEDEVAAKEGRGDLERVDAADDVILPFNLSLSFSFSARKLGLVAVERRAPPNEEAFVEPEVAETQAGIGGIAGTVFSALVESLCIPLVVGAGGTSAGLPFPRFQTF